MAPDRGSKDRISLDVTISARSSLPKASPRGVLPKQKVWTELLPKVTTDTPPFGQLTAAGNRGKPGSPPIWVTTRYWPLGEIAIAPGWAGTLIARVTFFSATDITSIRLAVKLAT